MNQSTRWIIGAALLIAFTLPAPAGWDEAVKALDSNDYKTAIQHFGLVAEQGSSTGAGEIAQIYQKSGPTQNLVKAYMWYAIAIYLLPANLREHETDIIGLAQASLSSDMTTTQIDEAERLAKEWLKIHGKK